MSWGWTCCCGACCCTKRSYKIILNDLEGSGSTELCNLYDREWCVRQIYCVSGYARYLTADPTNNWAGFTVDYSFADLTTDNDEDALTSSNVYGTDHSILGCEGATEHIYCEMELGCVLGSGSGSGTYGDSYASVKFWLVCRNPHPTLDGVFVDVTTLIAEYHLDFDLWDCNGTNTLSLVYYDNRCGDWPATLTATAGGLCYTCGECLHTPDLGTPGDPILVDLSDWGVCPTCCMNSQYTPEFYAQGGYLYPSPTVFLDLYTYPLALCSEGFCIYQDIGGQGATWKEYTTPPLDGLVICIKAFIEFNFIEGATASNGSGGGMGIHIGDAAALLLNQTSDGVYAFASCVRYCGDPAAAVDEPDYLNPGCSPYAFLYGTSGGSPPMEYITNYHNRIPCCPVGCQRSIGMLAGDVNGAWVQIRISDVSSGGGVYRVEYWVSPDSIAGPDPTISSRIQILRTIEDVEIDFGSTFTAGVQHSFGYQEPYSPDARWSNITIRTSADPDGPDCDEASDECLCLPSTDYSPKITIEVPLEDKGITCVSCDCISAMEICLTAPDANECLWRKDFGTIANSPWSCTTDATRVVLYFNANRLIAKFYSSSLEDETVEDAAYTTDPYNATGSYGWNCDDTDIWMDYSPSGGAPLDSKCNWPDIIKLNMHGSTCITCKPCDNEFDDAFPWGIRAIVVYDGDVYSFCCDAVSNCDWAGDSIDLPGTNGDALYAVFQTGKTPTKFARLLVYIVNGVTFTLIGVYNYNFDLSGFNCNADNDLDLAAGVSGACGSEIDVVGYTNLLDATATVNGQQCFVCDGIEIPATVTATYQDNSGVCCDNGSSGTLTRAAGSNTWDGTITCPGTGETVNLSMRQTNNYVQDLRLTSDFANGCDVGLINASPTGGSTCNSVTFLVTNNFPFDYVVITW